MPRRSSCPFKAKLSPHPKAQVTAGSVSSHWHSSGQYAKYKLHPWELCLLETMPVKAGKSSSVQYMSFGSSNDAGFGAGISPTYSACHTDAFLPATSFERNNSSTAHEQVPIFKLLTNLGNWGQQQEHMKNAVKNPSIFPPNIKFISPQTVLSQPQHSFL